VNIPAIDAASAVSVPGICGSPDVDPGGSTGICSTLKGSVGARSIMGTHGGMCSEPERSGSPLFF